MRKRPTTRKAQARPIQRFFGDEYVKIISIPSVAASYNLEMNHVDRGDQRRSYQGYSHALRRGPWQALSWTFLLDITLVNSFILQLHGMPKWKKIRLQNDWRQCICDALFQAFSTTSQQRKRLRSGDEVTPVEQHEFIRRGKKSNCLACQGYRLGEMRRKRRALSVFSGNIKRSQTVMGCRQCDVAICNSANCWYFYHDIN